MEKRQSKFITTLIVLILYFIFILKFSSSELSFVNFMSYLIFLSIILIIYYKDLLDCFKKFKKDKKKKRTILLYFAIFFLISTVLSNIIISVISSSMGSEFNADSSSLTIYSLFELLPFGTLFATFFTVVYTPIVEELVFRKSIRDVLSNKLVFIIISSLLSWYFQVTLLNPTMPEFVYAISALLPSIFASYILVKKDNILYCIFPRMLYNLVICFIQLIGLFVK